MKFEKKCSYIPIQLEFLKLREYVISLSKMILLILTDTYIISLSFIGY